MVARTASGTPWASKAPLIFSLSWRSTTVSSVQSKNAIGMPPPVLSLPVLVLVPRLALEVLPPLLESPVLLVASPLLVLRLVPSELPCVVEPVVVGVSVVGEASVVELELAPVVAVAPEVVPVLVPPSEPQLVAARAPRAVARARRAANMASRIDPGGEGACALFAYAASTGGRQGPLRANVRRRGGATCQSPWAPAPICVASWISVRSGTHIARLAARHAL